MKYKFTLIDSFNLTIEDISKEIYSCMIRRCEVEGLDRGSIQSWKINDIKLEGDKTTYSVEVIFG
jgi:hypothetical protein